MSEVTPATRDRDALTKQAADANIRLEELKAEYASNPEQRISRDKAELSRLESDPYHVHNSAREIEVIRSRIAQTETEATTAVAALVLSDAQRIDAVLDGKDLLGPGTTTEGQIPAEDFADAIREDIALGLNPQLLKSFHATGKSHDRLGHVVAKYWLDMFNADVEMRRKFVAGDPKMNRRFRAAHMYLAGAHEVSPEEERAYAATLTRGDN
jgi:hypothetical protein